LKSEKRHRAELNMQKIARGKLTAMRQGHFTPQRCSNRSPQNRMTFSVVEKGLASGSLVKNLKPRRMLEIYEEQLRAAEELGVRDVLVFERHVLPTAHVYKLASECCFSYSLCSQAARIGVATSRGDHPHRRRRRGPGRLWVRSDGA
jgi:hypothetical protein